MVSPFDVRPPCANGIDGRGPNGLPVLQLCDLTKWLDSTRQMHGERFSDETICGQDPYGDADTYVDGSLHVCTMSQLHVASSAANQDARSPRRHAPVGLKFDFDAPLL